MAKTGPDLHSVKHAFQTYLLRGESIDSAMSRAGVNDQSLAVQWIGEMHAAGKHEGHHEIAAAQTALSTLKYLCDSAETDEVRCAAARALLTYVSGRQKNRTTEKTAEKHISVTLPDNLWDFTP